MDKDKRMKFQSLAGRSKRDGASNVFATLNGVLNTSFKSKVYQPPGRFEIARSTSVQASFHTPAQAREYC